jgi:4-diphosphocytidyl-2-C-methyl-D-erythritol kinase
MSLLRAEALRHQPAPAGYRLGIHAFAKLNLGLWVGARRPDGYHEIRTVFQTVDLADTLYLRPKQKGLRLRVHVAGPARGRGLAIGPSRSNLVLRAARELQRLHNVRAGADLLLIKRIPAGSGLGGGSSDAVAALRGLGRLWKLRTSAAMLGKLALDLGSDCPFFLAGGRAVASGRGERLRRLPVPMLHRVLIALPRVGVSTATAYRLFAGGKRLTGRLRLRTLTTPISTWHHHVTARSLMPNLLEEVVCRRYPDIARARDSLERCGVSDVQMSGSGSAVFGFLPPGARSDRYVPMQPESSAALVLARFTRVGSRWTL